MLEKEDMKAAICELSYPMNTVDSRTSNGLMFEQLETRTKTRKSSEESCGHHVVTFSLFLVARAVV
jgi:hypothetical protein